ncbi:MAG: dipeptidase [Marinibacterium sp.]|nr:dipeptidase [Marinibacterium sp.]
MTHTTPLIFDGHNDVLSRLARHAGQGAADIFAASGEGAIDVARARQGGFAGGFFAVWIPSPGDPLDEDDEMTQPSYDLPLPAPIPSDRALPVALRQVSILLELERAGLVTVIRSTADLRRAMDTGTMAAILHMEGAEAIGADLHALDVFHAAGLRSLGPVWSRPTIFGDGVPFRFPATPDIGPGLSDHGRQLIRRCNALRIMIDLSHLNAAGFWDVARLSDAPLVATHSNAHAVTPHARNLTDDQLRAIADSGGMVGLNFATAFLRADGRMVPDVPFDQMLRHLDHLMGILGEDGVGLGSDYDGAVVPQQIADVSMLPRLRAAMQDHGYGPDLIAKICHGNWLQVLDRTWG